MEEQHFDYSIDSGENANDDNEVDFMENDDTTSTKTNETGLKMCMNAAGKVVMRCENSFGSTILDWLQMLGIFLASLAILAIITLITCRRPRKPVQRIAESLSQDHIYILENPPDYNCIMEFDMKELPSYSEAIQNDKVQFRLDSDTDDEEYNDKPCDVKAGV